MMKTMTIFLGLLAILNSVGSAQTEAGGQTAETRPAEAAASLQEQLIELRQQMGQLQAALEGVHKKSAMNGATDGMSMGMSEKGMKMGKDMSTAGRQKMGDMGMGKKGMKMGKDMSTAGRQKMGDMGMGMGGMKGMKMMGNSPGAGNSGFSSSLPGFPGISHLYHIGSTGFYLDHAEHLNLTRLQRRKLAVLQESAAIQQATIARRNEQIEQDVWVLTSVDSPDIIQLTKKLQERSALDVEQRLNFIRTVGKAAMTLTASQRRKLEGEFELMAESAESKPTPKANK